MPFLQEIFILFLALMGIWIGSGLAITAVDKLANNIKQSSFLLSFFVLGFFTSISEIGVAFNSLIEKTPQVSAGNLLGGSIVLILLVIPALGILSKGIKLDHSFGYKGVLACVVFILIPFFLLMDKQLSVIDGFILISLYFILALYLYKSFGSNPQVAQTEVLKQSSKVFLFISILLGATILIVASNYLVDIIILIAEEMKISPFIISLLGLSIGTNLPEITMAIRSVLAGKSQIALGNYLGSAIFNPFVLGTLGVLSGGFVIQAGFTQPLVFSIFGFILFFLFIKSNNFLSRRESFILLGIYLLFIANEIMLQL